MRGRARPNRQSRRANHQPSDKSTGTTSSSSHDPRPPWPRSNYTSVPAYASISSGAAVSIVLKQDQPTGHQVQGIVADLLTRGDHPRGVKVRLRDGRVGRVQRLVSEVEGTRGESLVGGVEANLGRDGERRGFGSGPVAQVRRARDVRENDDYLFDESQARSSGVGGLFAALEAADAQHEQRGAWDCIGPSRRENGGGMAICPVCGEFEGDETAVAHHVAGHFGEGL